MAKKSSSKTKQAQYAAYKTAFKWKSNRERKLRKALKKNPANLQIVEALKNVSYRRKDPKSKAWSTATKTAASLIKYFCGKCPVEVFNTNNDIRKASIRALIDTSPFKGIHHDNREDFFSIGARANYKC